MKKKKYESLLEPLQLELNNVARWLQHTGKRIVIVFEGRDTAGKRLGVMGRPIKVMIEDDERQIHPVFLCCKGCRRKALADPDKTLAKVEQLKAKVKASSLK